MNYNSIEGYIGKPIITQRRKDVKDEIKNDSVRFDSCFFDYNLVSATELLNKKEGKHEMKFGKNLENALWNKRLTQTDLADKIGVSKMAVSKFVNGEKLPSVSKLILISKAVRVSMDTLLLGDVKKKEF